MMSLKREEEEMSKMKATFLKALAVAAICSGVLLVPASRAQAHGWFGFNFGFYDPGSGVSVAIGAPAYYPAPVYPVVVPEPYVVYRPAVVVPRVVVPIYGPVYRYGDGYWRGHHRGHHRWGDD